MVRAGSVNEGRAWLRPAVAMFAVGWGSNQFVPLLLVYRQTLRLDEATLILIFALYAVGLAPGFLLGGPASDRYGRRRLVLVFTLVAAVASVILVGGHWTAVALAVGRLLTGLAAGVVFSVGTTWLKELSSDAQPGVAARRAAVSLSAGFGTGALGGGLLAQWGPAPDVLPHVLHVAMAMAGAVLAWPAPETRAPSGRLSWGAALRIPVAARARFLSAVVPVAPWVFACATTAFTVLPGRAPAFAHGIAPLATGIITALTLGVGIAVQPLARRLETIPGRAARWGLATAVVGFALAAIAAQTAAWPLVVAAAMILGAAYGQVLVAGLREVERLATPDTLATLMALFYALAYSGVFASYVIALTATLAGYPRTLALASLLALAVLAATTLLHRAAIRSGTVESRSIRN
jgi:Major Facilitator Superfamily